MNPITRMSLLLSVLVYGLTLSCQPPNDPDPPVDPGVITLELANQPRLTSMQVKLSANMADLPLDSLVLLRNDLPADTLRLMRPDTILSLTGLTPSTNYIWRVTGKKNTRPYASNPLPTRTMDTTSHFNVWNFDTLGAPGGVIRDLAYVNDTCIWAVGEIPVYPRDSRDRYNAAKWNGRSWEKKRIKTIIFNNIDTAVTILYTITFIDGLLWVTTEDGAYATSNDNGKSWKPGRFDKGTRRGLITKSWSNSRNNIYWVGTNGSVTHYDGNSIKLIETGTNVDLQDIWGTETGEVWACGYDIDSPVGVLIRKTGAGFEVMYETGKPSRISGYLRVITSLWAPEPDLYWVNSSARIVLQPTDSVENIHVFPAGAQSGFLHSSIYRIRGTDINDIFLCGVGGTLWHYNGSSFYRYPEAIYAYDRLYALIATKHIIMAAGSRGPDDGIPIWIARRN